MKHESPMTPEQERQMLEHFREHAQGEPSAALDAQILAAARQAVEQSHKEKHRAGLGVRLHNWLFGEGGRQRWVVSLAGFACLAVGVSLTWRHYEQSPVSYDAVPAFAPAMKQAAPMPAVPAAEMRARAMPETNRVVPRAAAVEQAAKSTQGFSAQADAVMESAVPTQDLLLQELRELRQAGQQREAEALAERIKQAYPELDLEARLLELEASE